MADDTYLTNPDQPPAALAPLGTGGLAALSGGQLAVVPALPASDSNWFFDLFGPTYDDYYDWTPVPSNPSPQSPPVGGTVAVGVGVEPATPAPSSGGGSAPPPSSAGGSSPAPSSGSGSTSPASPGAPSAPLVPINPSAPSVPTPAVPAPIAEPQAAASAAPAPSPVTVVIAPYPVPSSAAPSSAAPSSAPAATDEPKVEEVQLASAPVEKTLTAVAYNPRFRESRSRGQDALLQELLDEEGLSIRMHTKDSAPLAFVVPEGCDSVEFSYSAIEINPDLGCDDDLSQVVTIGEAQLQSDDGTRAAIEPGSLAAGAPLLVTLPWRAASHVNLNANHLMVTVHARFYAETESVEGEGLA